MKTRIVLLLVVGVVVLGMGLITLRASPTLGKAVLDSEAATLRGGCEWKCVHWRMGCGNGGDCSARSEVYMNDNKGDQQNQIPINKETESCGSIDGSSCIDWFTPHLMRCIPDSK